MNFLENCELFVPNTLQPMTLLDIRKNQKGRITGLIEDPSLRSQCIRLGLNIDAVLICIERLPGGTVVVQAHRQEIALGRDLAQAITVVLL